MTSVSYMIYKSRIRELQQQQDEEKKRRTITEATRRAQKKSFSSEEGSVVEDASLSSAISNTKSSNASSSELLYGIEFADNSNSSLHFVPSAVTTTTTAAAAGNGGSSSMSFDGTMKTAPADMGTSATSLASSILSTATPTTAATATPAISGAEKPRTNLPSQHPPQPPQQQHDSYGSPSASSVLKSAAAAAAPLTAADPSSSTSKTGEPTPPLSSSSASLSFHTSDRARELFSSFRQKSIMRTSIPEGEDEDALSLPSTLLPAREKWTSYGTTAPNQPTHHATKTTTKTTPTKLATTKTSLRDIIHQSGLLQELDSLVKMQQQSPEPQPQGNTNVHDGDYAYKNNYNDDDFAGEEYTEELKTNDSDDDDNEANENGQGDEDLPAMLRNILERPPESMVDQALKDVLEDVLTMDAQEPIPCTCSRDDDADASQTKPCLYHPPPGTVSPLSSFVQPQLLQRPGSVIHRNSVYSLMEDSVILEEPDMERYGTGMMTMDTDIRSTDEFSMELGISDGDDDDDVNNNNYNNSDGSLGYSKSCHLTLHDSGLSKQSPRSTQSGHSAHSHPPVERHLSLIESEYSSDDLMQQLQQQAQQQQQQQQQEQQQKKDDEGNDDENDDGGELHGPRRQESHESDFSLHPFDSHQSSVASFDEIPHYCVPQFEPQFLTPGSQRGDGDTPGAPPIDFEKYSPPQQESSLPSRSLILKRPPLSQRGMGGGTGTRKKSPPRARPPRPLGQKKTALEEADEILNSEHVPSSIERLDSVMSYQSISSEITFLSDGGSLVRGGEQNNLKIDPRAPQYQMAMEQARQQQEQEQQQSEYNTGDTTTRTRNVVAMGGAAVAPPVRQMTPPIGVVPHSGGATTMQPPMRHQTPPQENVRTDIGSGSSSGSGSSDKSPQPPTRKATPLMNRMETTTSTILEDKEYDDEDHGQQQYQPNFDEKPSTDELGTASSHSHAAIPPKRQATPTLVDAGGELGTASSHSTAAIPPKRQATPTLIDAGGELGTASSHSTAAIPPTRQPTPLLDPLITSGSSPSPPTRKETPQAPPQITGSSPTPPTRKETPVSVEVPENSKTHKGETCRFATQSLGKIGAIDVEALGLPGASSAPPIRKQTPPGPPPAVATSPSPPVRKRTPPDSQLENDVDDEEDFTNVPLSGFGRRGSVGGEALDPPRVKTIAPSPSPPMRKQTPTAPPATTASGPAPPVRKHTAPTTQQPPVQNVVDKEEEDCSNIPLSGFGRKGSAGGTAAVDPPPAKNKAPSPSPPIRKQTPSAPPAATATGPAPPVRKHTGPNSQQPQPQSFVDDEDDYSNIPLTMSPGRKGSASGAALDPPREKILAASAAPPIRKQTPPEPPAITPTPPMRKRTPPDNEIPQQSGSSSEDDFNDIPLSQSFGRKGTIGGPALERPQPQDPSFQEFMSSPSVGSRPSLKIPRTPKHDSNPLMFPHTLGDSERSGAVNQIDWDDSETSDFSFDSRPPLKIPSTPKHDSNPLMFPHTLGLSERSGAVNHIDLDESETEDYSDPVVDYDGDDDSEEDEYDDSDGDHEDDEDGCDEEETEREEGTEVEESGSADYDYSDDTSVSQESILGPFASPNPAPRRLHLKIESSPRHDSNPLLYPMGLNFFPPSPKKLPPPPMRVASPAIPTENAIKITSRRIPSLLLPLESSSSDEEDEQNRAKAKKKKKEMASHAPPAERASSSTPPLGLGVVATHSPKAAPQPAEGQTTSYTPSEASPSAQTTEKPETETLSLDEAFPSRPPAADPSCSEQKSSHAPSTVPAPTPKRMESHLGRPSTQGCSVSASTIAPEVLATAASERKPAPTSNRSANYQPASRHPSEATSLPPTTEKHQRETPSSEQTSHMKPPVAHPSLSAQKLRPKPSQAPTTAPATVPIRMVSPRRKNKNSVKIPSVQLSVASISVASIRVKMCPMEIHYVLVEGQEEYHEGYYSGPINAEGKMNGNGCFWFTTGDVYLGQFCDGMLHGIGAMAIADENGKKHVFKGHFRNNEFIGEVQMEGESVC